MKEEKTTFSAGVGRLRGLPAFYSRCSSAVSDCSAVRRVRPGSKKNPEELAEVINACIPGPVAEGLKEQQKKIRPGGGESRPCAGKKEQRAPRQICRRTR